MTYNNSTVYSTKSIFLGYGNIDRVIGFDLDGAKLVLKDLAVFHAVPLALRLTKPDVFDSKVKPNCLQLVMPEFPKPKDPPPKSEWMIYIEQQEECKPYIEQITKLMEDMFNGDKPNAFLDRPCDELAGSILHCDMWSNNTMQKFEEGKLVQNKLIDFQIYMYANFICDLIFFVWSSVQYDVVKEHHDELIELYHKYFCDTLEKLGCDTTPFEMTKFLEMINHHAPSEFFHIVFMATPIQGPRGEFAMKMDEDDMSEMMKTALVTLEAKEKIAQVVYEFGRRGWIEH